MASLRWSLFARIQYAGETRVLRLGNAPRLGASLAFSSGLELCLTRGGGITAFPSDGNLANSSEAGDEENLVYLRSSC